MRSLAALLLIGIGCGPSGPSGTPEQQAAARGRSIYAMSCAMSCHNPDPSRSGPLAPPVTGSSLELLEARVLRGQYPPGYKPKQDTRIMVPLPQLASHIPDLAAYLK